MNLAWPFDREKWYRLAEFSAFEDELLGARRQDETLDHRLRLAKEPWMKLRNEELYPVLYFGRHLHVAEEAFFKIGAAGADADVELWVGDASPRRLQITTAGAHWTEGEAWGLGHKLLMEKLNTKGTVSGTGPFKRENDGTISNREEAISSAERDPPHLQGLVGALRGKQHHRLSSCELLVYAGGYCQIMNLEVFKRMAHEAMRAVPLTDFADVHIFDSADGFIVSLQAGL